MVFFYMIERKLHSLGKKEEQRVKEIQRQRQKHRRNSKNQLPSGFGRKKQHR